MMNNISRSISSDREIVLTTLIGYLMKPSQLSFDELFPGDRQAVLRSIYFLLNNQGSNNLYHFVFHTLPRILEQLHHTTVRVNVEYQGQIRGRVIWPATYKARFSQDYNPNLYSCRQVQSFFDTPENQLLKYFIEEINRCLRSIPAAIRSGFCLLPMAKNLTVISIVKQLQVLEARIQNALENIYMRQVTSTMQINSIHFQQAENSRLEEYSAVASLYRDYRQLIEHSDWHPFPIDGQCFLLLPNQVNGNTETWIKTAAALLRTYQLNKNLSH
jgi:hypothetical protein